MRRRGDIRRAADANRISECGPDLMSYVLERKKNQAATVLMVIVHHQARLDKFLLPHVSKCQVPSCVTFFLPIQTDMFVLGNVINTSYPGLCYVSAVTKMVVIPPYSMPAILPPHLRQAGNSKLRLACYQAAAWYMGLQMNAMLAPQETAQKSQLDLS